MASLAGAVWVPWAGGECWAWLKSGLDWAGLAYADGAGLAAAAGAGWLPPTAAAPMLPARASRARPAGMRTDQRWRHFLRGGSGLGIWVGASLMVMVVSASVQWVVRQGSGRRLPCLRGQLVEQLREPVRPLGA